MYEKATIRQRVLTSLKYSERVQTSTYVESVDDAQDSTLGDDTLLEEQYIIVIGRARRQTRPSK